MLGWSWGWLKTLGKDGGTWLIAGLSPIVAAANDVIISRASGVHVPITAGTVLLPAIPIFLKGLGALLARSPKDKPTAPPIEEDSDLKVE